MKASERQFLITDVLTGLGIESVTLSRTGHVVDNWERQDYTRLCRQGLAMPDSDILLTHTLRTPFR